jgi:hypothetical protein
MGSVSRFRQKATVPTAGGLTCWLALDHGRKGLTAPLVAGEPVGDIGLIPPSGCVSPLTPFRPGWTGLKGARLAIRQARKRAYKAKLRAQQ